MSKNEHANVCEARYPNTSGWKSPLKPENKAHSKMYEMKDINGMYKSGALISSEGGAYATPAPEEPELSEVVIRDQLR